MTPELAALIAELRYLEARSTRPPWTVDRLAKEDDDESMITFGGSIGPVGNRDWSYSAWIGGIKPNDLALMAKMRTACPALITEVERMANMLQFVQEQLADAEDLASKKGRIATEALNEVERLAASNLQLLNMIEQLHSLTEEEDPIEVGCYCSSCDGLPMECVWCRAKKLIRENGGS